MMNIFWPNYRISIELPLRRTLQGSVRYSTKISRKERNEEATQRHSFASCIFLCGLCVKQNAE